MWLRVALVPSFGYSAKFNCMTRPQLVYTFTFRKGIWVVSSVFSYKQSCHDLSSTDLLGIGAHVSLQHTTGVASLGQGICEYPTLYKIILGCVPVYTLDSNCVQESPSSSTRATFSLPHRGPSERCEMAVYCDLGL